MQHRWLKCREVVLCKHRNHAEDKRQHEVDLLFALKIGRKTGVNDAAGRLPCPHQQTQ